MIPSRILPFLLASLLPLGAQKKEDVDKVRKNILEQVPVGARSINVTIPTYDKEMKKASLLTAKAMIVDSDESLTAESLVLRIFDKEEEIRGVATIPEAEYLLNEERLVASGEILLKSTKNEFLVRCQGGIFQLQDRQGLLLGPAETMFLNIPKKKRVAMKTTPLLPLVAGLQMLVAAPPPAITAEELAEFERQVATKPPATEINAEELSNFERQVAPRIIPQMEAAENFAQADIRNEEIAKRLSLYLAKIGKSDLILQNQAPALIKPEIPFTDLFKPEKDQIVVKSDGGIYFNGDNFELVYLGNTSLKGSGMNMSCNKDMKIIFDPPVEKPKEKDGDEKDNGLSAVGEMKLVTANGDIRLNGVTDKGQQVMLEADRALYDKAKETLTIRGDQMKFRMGNNAGFATKKNAFAVFKFEGKKIKSAQFSKGGWKFSLRDPKNKEQAVIPFAKLFNPANDQILVKSDGRIYFDGDDFELVYLGNTSVKGNDMNFTCNKDMKIMFDPPAKKTQPKPGEENNNGLSAVGEMKQVSASGKIRVNGINAKGEPIMLEADRALYDKAKETITIRGDQLKFRQGNDAASSTRKNAFAILKFDGKKIKPERFSKGWEFGFKNPQKKKKK